MLAGSVSREAALQAIAAIPHWHHKFEIAPGVATPGAYDPGSLFAQLGLAQDLRGLRALDIGCRDGYFSFEMERRGAEVVAVDYMPADKIGYGPLAKLFGSKSQFLHANLFDLRSGDLGKFDIVLFLGVLYHLPDPMRGIAVVRDLCRGRVYVESQVMDHALLQADGTFIDFAKVHPELAKLPLMQFYPKNSLYGDWTNYWAPTSAGLKAMMEENRFQVLDCALAGQRAFLRADVVEDSTLEFHGRISSGTVK